MRSGAGRPARPRGLLCRSSRGSERQVYKARPGPRRRKGAGSIMKVARVQRSDGLGIVSRACRTGRRRSEHAAHREAGKRVKRFIAASSFRAIRDGRTSNGGACRDGRRPNQLLLAAGCERVRAAGAFPACGAAADGRHVRDADLAIDRAQRSGCCLRGCALRRSSKAGHYVHTKAGSEEQDPAYEGGSKDPPLRLTELLTPEISVIRPAPSKPERFTHSLTWCRSCRTCSSCRCES